MKRGSFTMRAVTPRRQTKWLHSIFPGGLLLLLVHSASGRTVKIFVQPPPASNTPSTEVEGNGSNSQLYAYTLSASVESLIFYATTYDYDTCQVVGSQLIPESSPDYGTLAFSTVNLPIGGNGPCSAAVIPWLTVSYTWTAGTDNPQNRNIKDRFRLKWISGNTLLEVVPFQIDVGPRIFFQAQNGHEYDVTGSTLTVDAGQNVVLNEGHSPNGLSFNNVSFNPDGIQTQLWSVSDPDDVIGGYEPTPETCAAQEGCLVPVITNSPSLQAYWTKPGGPRGVTLSYTLSSGQSNSISTKVNVLGPTQASIMKPSSTSAPPTKGQIQIVTQQSVNFENPPYLSCGNQSIPCITFNLQNVPNGYSADDFFWIQLVETEKYEYFYLDGSKETCIGYPGGLDADGDLGFYYAEGPTTNDSPDIQLNVGTSPLAVTRSFGARMFLMWRSETANAIPIPLGYINWSWAGRAAITADHGWEMTSSQVNPNTSGFIRNAQYPQWPGLARNLVSCSSS